MRKTTCRQARELMSAKLDGLLAAEDERRLLAHFQDCPDCGEHWACLMMLERDLCAVEMAKPPAALAERVLARVQRHVRQNSQAHEPNVGTMALVVTGSVVCLSAATIACGILGVLTLPHVYLFLREIGEWFGRLVTVASAVRAVAAAIWDIAELATRTLLPTVASSIAVLSVCLLLLWVYVVTNWRGVPVIHSGGPISPSEGLIGKLGNGGES